MKFPKSGQKSRFRKSIARMASPEAGSQKTIRATTGTGSLRKIANITRDRFYISIPIPKKLKIFEKKILFNLIFNFLKIEMEKKIDFSLLSFRARENSKEKFQRMKDGSIHPTRQT